MKTKKASSRHLPTLPLLVLVACLAPHELFSADAAGAAGGEREIVELETYIVNGITESAVRAQQIKRESLRIVDSIVADDINKLPDLSVTEALQRVTGISITRDLGEGANVALRGLNEVEVEMNGKQVFSPQVVTGVSYYHKKIDGYTQRVTSVEVYDGIEYDFGRYKRSTMLRFKAWK